ncbi:MEDS domain-containing protein [Leifsonia sp. LS-T14]|uniref:MEDS domain-containing protein n=1 Tax=unclassified Leifsonia TaxID=2663824 RepID=UPI0035A584F7
MAAEGGRPDTVTFAGGVLDRYRHVCAFVKSEAEADAVLDPFVQGGLDGDDRLLYLVDPAEPAVPLRRVRRLGHDPAALLDEHRLTVLTWAETYLRTGAFDQDDMLGQLDTMLGGPAVPRIRLLADMGWAAGDPDAAVQLIEFEARANFLHARHQHVVICAYETSRFDGAFIVDILRTHPMVLIGGILQENPFFVPPEEFLEERVAVGRG